MKTKTILEALKEHRPNSKSASRDILHIYSVYSQPFDRLTVLSLFDVPPQVTWHKSPMSEDKRWFITIDKVKYYPENISEFITLIKCLGKLNLVPRFEGNEVNASLLWNRKQ